MIDLLKVVELAVCVNRINVAAGQAAAEKNASGIAGVAQAPPPH